MATTDSEPVAKPTTRTGKPRKSEARQRTGLLAVRLLPDEVAAVKAHAATLGFGSTAAYVRSLILEDVAS